MKFLFVLSFLFIKVSYFPSISLLLWMSLAIAIDFISGVAKAVVTKQARTSYGYRKTIVKFFQYGGALFVSIALSNTLKGNEIFGLQNALSYLTDALIILITYIEVTSIFENLNAIDKNTLFSKYFIQPVLKILTWQIKNNPIVKESESKS